MPEDFAPLSEFFDRARKVAKPLFLGNVGRDGHTEETVNATVTFVELDGEWIAVTCQHVVHSAEECGGGRWQACYVEVAGKKTEMGRFSPCLAQDRMEEPPDLAARTITDRLKDRLRDDGVEAIQLASVSEWPEGINCEAFGFATEMKFPTGRPMDDGTPQLVATLGISARAALTGLRDSEIFRLSAQAERGQRGLDFSGMSGGPIFCVDETGARLLGVVRGGVNSDKSTGQAVSSDYIDLFGQRVDADRLRLILENAAN